MPESGDLNVDVQKIEYKGAHVAQEADGKKVLVLLTRPTVDSFRNHPMGIPLRQAVMLRRRLNELYENSAWFKEATDKVDELKVAWERQEPAVDG